MARILVVDDELSIVQVLNTLLERGGHTVATAIDGEQAIKALKEDVFDLMITDVRLPVMDGITLLHKSKELQSHLAVIVMTAYAGVDNAVEAMKNGAFDYVTKPFKFDELMLTIERALSYEKILAENKVLKTTLKTKYHFNFIVGDSEPMLEIYRLIEKIARTNSTVLILGESGTGKELIARALHESSSRCDGPLIQVNCSAMPENLLESELFGYVKGAFTGANNNKKGLFETAHGGTILLDEIGSIPISMQMKLLRVLQEKEIRRVGGTENIPVDVRVIAATNENLEDMIANGTFREDLYFRLSVIPINIPPLRERKDDIPMLVAHFLAEFEKENKVKITMDSKAVDSLVEHAWPGNVRQLENFINRIATLNETGNIELSELPEDLVGSTPLNSSGENTLINSSTQDGVVPLKQHMKSIEESYVKQVIEKFDGDKEAASRHLGISLATLYRKYGS
jgi:DNA-binding NtrC family response regulator